MTDDDIWQAYPLPGPPIPKGSPLEPVTALVENCTIAELVKDYRETDAKLDELNVRHKEELAVINRRLNLLTGALTILLDKTGQTNATTEFGSARFYKTEKIKVVDRETYLKWVMDNRAFDVMTSAVSKDAVRDRRKRGEEVPGLEITLGRALSVWKP